MTKVVENQMLHTVFSGFPKQSSQQSAPAINTGVKNEFFSFFSKTVGVKPVTVVK